MNGAQKERCSSFYQRHLDLSSYLQEELVSVIVDDGLLDTVDSSLFDKPMLEVSGSMQSLADLTSASDIAGRYTIRQLSSDIPKLPGMLLMAIMKFINSTRFVKFETETIKGLIRLTGWLHWLLGKNVQWGSENVQRYLRMPDNDFQHLKLLTIPYAETVRIELCDELVDALIQVYDQTLVWGIPFSTLEPHLYMSWALDSNRFQEQTVGLTLREIQGAKAKRNHPGDHSGDHQHTRGPGSSCGPIQISDSHASDDNMQIQSHDNESPTSVIGCTAGCTDSGSVTIGSASARISGNAPEEVLHHEVRHHGKPKRGKKRRALLEAPIDRSAHSEVPVENVAVNDMVPALEFKVGSICMMEHLSLEQRRLCEGLSPERREKYLMERLLQTLAFEVVHPAVL